MMYGASDPLHHRPMRVIFWVSRNAR
eukprot:COSAG02_NODE_63835_length_262_cov_0.638037_1_plen_25_part_01